VIANGYTKGKGMNLVDWRNFAERQGMTVDEFKKEIFTAACAIAATDLDQQNKEGMALKFKCNDGVSDLELHVRRI